MRIQGLIAAALSAALAGCGMVSRVSVGGGDFGATGEGPGTTRTYDVSPFSRIEAGAAFEIEYKVGHKTHVEIEAPQDVFDHLKVESEHDELHLGIRDSMNTNGPIRVKLTSPSLEGISLSGASKGRFAGISAHKFEADLSGSSRAQVEGSAHEIQVDLSGSSELETATRGDFSLSGTLSGSGNLKAAGEVNRMDLNVSGNSRVELAHLAAREGILNMAGASSISSTGHADSLSLSVSGASTADFRSVKVRTARVSADGASHVSVGETEALTATASGASTIQYTGSPRIVQSVSGASSIGHS